MSPSTTARRRAALEAAREAEEQRRRRRRLLVTVIGAALVLGLVVGVVLLFNRKPDPPEQKGEQRRPPSATSTHGFAVASRDKQPAADVPHVTIYADYQCPVCAYLEKSHAEAFNKLVDEGRITLEHHLASFMDQPLRNDSSRLAAIAAAAADEVGRFREYHSVVFAHQPDEGRGYTETQLREEFPAQAGITGADLVTFQQRFDERAYNDFVVQANTWFLEESGFTGTPTVTVNGTVLPMIGQDGSFLVEPDPEALMRAIEELNG